MDIQGDVVSALAVSSLATQPRRSLVVDALNKLSYSSPPKATATSRACRCAKKNEQPLSPSTSALSDLSAPPPTHTHAGQSIWLRADVCGRQRLSFRRLDEARDKWTARKTAEVADEKRVLPLSTDTLLCEMIHAQVNKTGIHTHHCSCYFVAFVWLLPRVVAVAASNIK